ncbi:MAG: MFS transporter [Chthoniobacterales bacterium]
MLNKINKNVVVLVALYIIPLNGLSVDIYVPSLPAVADYFFTSHLLVQSTISIYILGLGISQLVCGNIIDHFGRRTPLLISLCGYFIVSTLIIVSKSISVVTYLRFIQGVCMGFSAVSARSIFPDLFSGEEYYKKASYITISFAIGPIVAPAIGGYLQHYLGWQSCFYFLVLYSLIGIWLVFFLVPETVKVKKQLSFKLIMVHYVEMLSHKSFVLGLICLIMLATISTLFCLVGPFLIQNRLHYSPIVYGNMALLCGLSWFSGNVLNRILLKTPGQKKINLALWFISLDLLLMLFLAHYWFNLYVIIIPVSFMLVAASIMFSNYFVYLPTLFPQYEASSAAFMAGSFSLISSGICALLSKIITTENQIPLIYGYLSLVLICIAANRLNKGEV